MLRQLFLAASLTISLAASELYLSIGSNVARLNPILATDSASGEITQWLFSSLISYDRDANIRPELAKSYKFIDDKTLVFEMRQDAFWHDGMPITAEDAVFTYETIKSPKVFTAYAEEFRKVESVKTDGKYKIVVKYKEPYFKALEAWMMPLLPKHILGGEKDLMTSRYNFAPVGSGDFRIEKLETSKDIELFAFDKYSPHKPKIDKIVYKFLPDSSTNFLMLKTSKLDMGGLSPLQLEKQLDEDFHKKFQIIEKPDNSYTYLGFNLQNPKFKDKRVREALSLAIDRQELVDIIFLGHARVCTGPFLPDSFAFNPVVKAPTRDVTKARKLLRDAGYDEAHPLEFEIATNSNNRLRMYAAEIIQRQLLAIGVKAKIRGMEWQAFLNTVVHPRKFDTVLLGWGLSIVPDAYTIWHGSQVGKKGGFNFISYQNGKVDALIEKAEKTIDKRLLATYFKDIFAEIADDKPMLFLYIPNSIQAVSKSIKNIDPGITGIMHNRIDWIKE
jgi:peptide/nickel transport system substrate-binding protein